MHFPSPYEEILETYYALCDLICIMVLNKGHTTLHYNYTTQVSNNYKINNETIVVKRYIEETYVMVNECTLLQVLIKMALRLEF